MSYAPLVGHAGRGSFLGTDLLAARRRTAARDAEAHHAAAYRPGFKFRSQTEDAVDSVYRNIAEGFGYESHGEFARYLEVSRSSLNELRDCLRSAHVKGYVSGLDLAPHYALMRRLYPALNNFIAYLRRTRRKRPRTDKNPPRTDRDPDRTD
jgi:four helix bundle protein